MLVFFFFFFSFKAKTLKWCFDQLHLFFKVLTKIDQLQVNDISYNFLSSTGVMFRIQHPLKGLLKSMAEGRPIQEQRFIFSTFKKMYIYCSNQVSSNQKSKFPQRKANGAVHVVHWYISILHETDFFHAPVSISWKSYAPYCEINQACKF